MDQAHGQQLGTYLREQREARHLTTRALAALVGIDMAQIVRLENGQVQSPKADLLASIAEKLELPLSDIFIVAGYAAPRELPSFQPYLRAKYCDLPPEAVSELDVMFHRIAKKYGTNGPKDGEDER